LENDGIRGCLQQTHSLTQESDTVKGDPGESPGYEEHLEYEVHSMAGRTFGDDPNYKEF